jgi:hypothetical protein
MLSKLETPEAEYIYNGNGWGHFAINCSCKGKDGSYHGCRYKNLDKEDEEDFRNYDSLRMKEYEHTFLISEFMFSQELKWRREDKKPPLIIICNDCGREFSFTLKSYLKLKAKMEKVD